MKLSNQHLPSEFIGQELASEHFFVLSSRMKKESFAEFFSGVAFTDDKLIMGSTGFQDFKQNNPEKKISQELSDGRFIVGEHINDDFLITTDFSGQFIVYLWQQGNSWALSNSLFVLAREIEALGETPTLYSPALAVFSSGKKDRDHGQIISEKTTIENAICVSAGASIRISFHAEKAIIAAIHPRAEITPNSDRTQYLENLLSFISKWRERIRILAEDHVKMRINLSGGKDSRTVLALLNSVMGRNVIASTKKNGSVDEPIATEIIKNHATFEGITGKEPEYSLSSSENFALNMMSGAGTKRFDYRAHAGIYPNSVLWTGGASFDATVFRSPLSRRLENAEKTSLIKSEKIRTDVLNEYRQGMRDFPGGVEDKNAIFFHYAGYRARYHYGAKSLITASLSMMPLVSKGIAGVFLSAPDFNYIRHSGINYDIVSICAPDLLKYPFTGDYTKPNLVADGLTLNDVPKSNALTLYGTIESSISTKVNGSRKTFGPDGISVIKKIFPEAIRRFGNHFESHVLHEAQREINEAKSISQFRTAALLCGLVFLFPETNPNSLNG